MKKILKDGFVLLKNDIKKAKWAVIFIIAYFVFGSQFLPGICPLVWITGFPCPACGLKRYICKKPIGKWFKTGCVVCVVLMVIYYVWRMYRYFPDQPPMSYYHYNLLRLLMDVAFGALK